jgi:ribosomal protein L7/L12
VNRTLAIAWIWRLALAILAWQALASGTPVVIGLGAALLVHVVRSSLQALRPKKLDQTALQAGDSKVVLEPVGHRFIDVIRVLHNDFNIGLSAAQTLVEKAPVTLEPAVVRSQAEDVVAKLKNAGAVASIITIEPEESAEDARR